MISDSICLDGCWGFRLGGEDAPARSIVVPSPWQAQFDDLRGKSGTAWYERVVELPAQWLQGQIKLRFGAVFHGCKVRLNGRLVGSHCGGFMPFAFDVTDDLLPGTNMLSVEVQGFEDDPETGLDLAEYPFGKQSWYGPLAGIWQSVHLERRNCDHIAAVQLVPDLTSGRVETRLTLARPSEGRLEVELRVREHGQEAPVAILLDVPASDGLELCAALYVSDPRPWSPDEPSLYQLTATLRCDGKALDVVERTFGFRSFTSEGGRFLLNGQPFYMRGALDQDYYPDTICTVPTIAFLEDQLMKAKALGLNTLRCHIKVPDPCYYDVADRLGMLIWTELPNAGRTTAASRHRAETLLKAIVDRDGHHPSIALWTIVNENWGTDLVHDAEHRAWLSRTFAWLKDYDPTRLVVDNSPLAPSMHVRTDVADFHYYSAIPDHRDEWDAFVDSLASRPAWLFSPHGDAVTTGSEPLMCSEFGNWGLPDPAALRDADGREPWWFETGHDWGDGVMYPHGIERRFADWHLERTFGSLGGLVEAAQWQQFRALKYQIEAMRRQPALAGYVITELTDCHWESNGLLDMRRNPRVFHETFACINAATVIVPRWQRLAYWAGETMRLELAIAHGASGAIVGATLELALADLRRIAVPPVAPGGVVALEPLEVAIPGHLSGIHRLRLELRGADGAILATNHLDIAVHPVRTAAPSSAGRVWSPEADIQERLGLLGYELATDLGTAEVVVARRADADLIDWTRHGGALLLMAETDMALQPLFPHWQNVRVQSRDGTMWRGDWASSFAWLTRSKLFDLPGGPLLDEAFDRVIPTHVIAGCNLMDFRARVHAGLMVGWIHKPTALIVERPYGRGRVVASTFRLWRDPAGADPTATVLLDRLLDLAQARRGEVAATQALLTAA